MSTPYTTAELIAECVERLGKAQAETVAATGRGNHYLTHALHGLCIAAVNVAAHANEGKDQGTAARVAVGGQGFELVRSCDPLDPWDHISRFPDGSTMFRVRVPGVSGTHRVHTSLPPGNVAVPLTAAERARARGDEKEAARLEAARG